MSQLRHLLPLPLILSIAAAQAPAPVPPPVAKPIPEAPTPPRPPIPIPPRPNPGVAVPGVVPPPPAGAPAGVPAAVPIRKPAIALGDTKIIEPIEYSPINGAELAALYRKYTGHRVIVSAAAAAKEFVFDQYAGPEDPLTYAEAAELLRKAAGIEGFVFMPDEIDKRLEYLNAETRLLGKGYKIFNETDELPEGDGIVSYVMTFKHIKPETAAQAFTQIIGQFGTYGSIATTNSQIIITENVSLIRRLIQLKNEIDIPGDIPRTQFISVKYADVTELATTINELLSAQQQTTRKPTAIQRNPVPTPGAPGAPPQPVQTNLSGAGGATNEDLPVQIIPEPRTNRIFAMGRPVDLLFVEGLIREFDVETSEKTFLRRKLRYLAVAEFLPIAENALNRAFTGTGEGAAGGGGVGGAASSSRSSTNRTTSSSSRTNNSSRTNSSFGNNNSSFGQGGSTGGIGGGVGGGGTSLGDPTVSTAPESRLVGRTLLVADNITNSIVVQGPPSGLEIVERLLDQIDVKADQVMIATVIGQLNLKDNMDYGMDTLFLGGDLLTRGGGGFGPILPIDPIPPTATGGSASGFNRGTLSGGGLRLYGKIGDDMHVYLKALQENEDFTVLARPQIFTANNQKGVISSGERIAIPTNSNTFFQTGGSSTQIQYQDVVLRLEVIPLINSESEITLQISLLSDEVNGNQVVAGAGANGSDLVVPRITTREVLTTVTIPNNETIVLGGLITVRTGEGVSGIPLLSSIPVLGKLFSSTNTKKERAELLVFIQPSIVTSRGSLDYTQADTDSRYKLAPDTRRFSDGEGVLPPVDPTPVSDKGSSPPPRATPVQYQPKPASTMRKSIRPTQVR